MVPGSQAGLIYERLMRCTRRGYARAFPQVSRAQGLHRRMLPDATEDFSLPGD